MAIPTREEWAALLASGFRSNGATGVPDTIWGLKIANGDDRYPPLPADRHDAAYFTGGDELDRLAADLEFRDGMLELVARGSWWLRVLRRKRAEAYYHGVRMMGMSHFERAWTMRGDP